MADCRACIGVDDVEFSIATVPIGVRETCNIVGITAPASAGETDRLLLRVAANQAALAFQARLPDAQKRVASGLDEHVVQRTAELAQANEALRRDSGPRGRFATLSLLGGSVIGGIPPPLRHGRPREGGNRQPPDCRIHWLRTGRDGIQTTNATGLGIGLSISRSIAEHHKSTSGRAQIPARELASHLPSLTSRTNPQQLKTLHTQNAATQSHLEGRR